MTGQPHHVEPPTGGYPPCPLCGSGCSALVPLTGAMHARPCGCVLLAGSWALVFPTPDGPPSWQRP